MMSGGYTSGVVSLVDDTRYVQRIWSLADLCLGHTLETLPACVGLG